MPPALTGTVTAKIAALVKFSGGGDQVVTLAQLADLPPERLAGAEVRLVRECPCCGAWRDAEQQLGRREEERDGQG